MDISQKSDTAYRTIGEVSSALGLPQHVLRFWETKFEQIRPMKRAAGRRFYHPDDVLLLAGIRNLLHDHGYTIRGVRRLMRAEGADHIRQLADPAAPKPAAEDEALSAEQRTQLEQARDFLSHARTLLDTDTD